MARIDYKVSDINDLVIDATAEDFKQVESDKFHTRNILQSNLGHYHWSPLLGANVLADLNSPKNLLNLKRKITEQFKADGYEVQEIDFEGNNINVRAILL
jgi:hypothetical protein